MGEVIAQFTDGRLLVQESKLCADRYCGSGVPFRIGGIKTIEKVLSVTNSLEKYGLITPLNEVKIGRPLSGRGAFSGQVQELADHLFIVMRRGDIGLGVTSGVWGHQISGAAVEAALSGVMPTSGLPYLGEVLSGNAYISGAVTITANVIGY